MQPSLSPLLAFTSQISDNLQQLSQITAACGSEPTPTQELQIYRAYCGVYDQIFAQLAFSPADQFGSSEFIRVTRPLMEGTARELAEFAQELGQHESCAPLRAPAQELLARLSQGISTLQQR